MKKNIILTKQKNIIKDFFYFIKDNNIKKSNVKDKWNKMDENDRNLIINRAKKENYKKLLNIKKEKKNITKNYKDLLPKYTSNKNNETKKNSSDKDKNEIIKQFLLNELK